MCPIDTVHPNWRRWWPAHADAITADMRHRLPAAIDAWGLRSLQPLTGGNVALVFAVQTSRGEAVLKLSPRVPGETEELADEAAALALWAAAGVAPRVHEVRDDGLTILMQRIRPGVNLRETGADALEIVTTLGGLCRRIHLAAPTGRFRALRHAVDVPSWRSGLTGTREAGELDRLLAPGDDDRLLHIDLHWLNALRGPDGWVAIDPKPVVGDPHADVFAFFDGPPIDTIPRGGTARKHVRALIVAYANAAGLDPDRLAAWVRIRALADASELAGADRADGRREQLLRLTEALS